MDPERDPKERLTNVFFSKLTINILQGFSFRCEFVCSVQGNQREFVEVAVAATCFKGLIR